ncbi:GtrA family protein [Qipengyuania sp. ASV99]|uniref:GtrA family protein n=1 Tax=Qipengyuania sp. ASV99 TaxID=3399681 RepID=UPI003A4C81C2
MLKGLIPVLSRYSIIGIASVLANNVILIAGHMLGVHYAISTLVCFFLIGALAYVGHANITFAARHSIAGYARYCGTQAFGLCLTLAILFVMIDLLAWPIWISAPLVSALMFVYTFIATRWAVTYGYNRSA